MPRKPPAPKRIRKPITLTLSPEMIDRVRAYCDKNKITRSQLVELSLERVLIDEEAKDG